MHARIRLCGPKNKPKMVFGLFNNNSIDDHSNDQSLNLIEEEEKQFNTIKRLHFWAMIFMGVQFIAYCGASATVEARTIASVAFQDDKGRGDDWCTGALSCEANTKSLGKIDVIFTIPLFVGLAALDHIICYYIISKYPEVAKNWLFVKQSNPIRWIEYSLSASTMAWALAALCRITDVHLWFLIFISTSVGMLCGWVLELLPLPNSEKERMWPMPISCSVIRLLVYVIGCITVFTPWLVLCCYFFNAATNSSSMPDFVYAAFLLTLFFFTTFGANSLFTHIYGYQTFARAEMIYIILSFTSKTFLAADVFGGLAAADD